MPQIMTPEEFFRIRSAAGFSQTGLADFFQMGKGGGRTVRRWEAGETKVPGPVAFAMRAIESGFAPEDWAFTAEEKVENA